MNPPSAAVPASEATTRRIAVIEESLRTFLFAWFGLVPLAGFPFALLSVIRGLRAGRHAAGLWNPAEGYRRAGVWLGFAGALLSLLAAAVLVSANFGD